MDASSVEAIACLAAHHFYSDQPEVALRYYRRLMQMGVGGAGPELWANAGLACFAAGQYDMALPAMERALALAGEDAAPDVWYNMGQVGLVAVEGARAGCGQ
jgi:tetratricopeptide repeat protein 8